MLPVSAVAADAVDVLDTRDARPEQRFGVWGELVDVACGPLKVTRRTGDAFDGTIVRRRFGAVQSTLVKAAPHAVESTERLVKRSPHPYVYVCTLLDGKAYLAQDDHEAVVGAGEIVVFDNTRPYLLAMDAPFRLFAVRFAHRLVGLQPQDTQPLTATAWSGRHGAGALLSHLLEGLARQLTTLPEPSTERLGDSLTSLIAAMFTERLHDNLTDPDVARRALLLRIQSFAREHLHDRALSPAMLAAQHHVSLRYLQVLFSEQGTSPARWIRDERLARCHDDLRNPRFAHLAVARIGERWGLPGASHFSRLFRERYGISPREFRREHLRACDGEPRPVLVAPADGWAHPPVGRRAEVGELALTAAFS